MREAVTVAAMRANRERDEALAEHIGRAVAREWWHAFNTKRTPGEPERPALEEVTRRG